MYHQISYCIESCANQMAVLGRMIGIGWHLDVVMNDKDNEQISCRIVPSHRIIEYGLYGLAIDLICYATPGRCETNVYMY